MVEWCVEGSLFSGLEISFCSLLVNMKRMKILREEGREGRKIRGKNKIRSQLKRNGEKSYSSAPFSSQ